MSDRFVIPPYATDISITKMNKSSYGMNGEKLIVYIIKSSPEESIKFEFTIHASSVQEAEAHLQSVMSRWLQTDGAKYYSVTDALNAGKQTGNKNPKGSKYIRGINEVKKISEGVYVITFSEGKGDSPVQYRVLAENEREAAENFMQAERDAERFRAEAWDFLPTFPNPRTPEQKQQNLVSELRQAVNDYRKAAKKAILSTTFPRERQKMVNRERTKAWKIANEYAQKTGRSHPALIERSIMSNDNAAYYDMASSGNIDKQGLAGLDLLLDFTPPAEVRMFDRVDDPSYEFHKTKVGASIATSRGGSQSAKRKTDRYWSRVMRGEFNE
jgi:hypothetical protein